MKYHDHTVHFIFSNGETVPLIRLSGHWLESCGFKPDCKYTVNELSGCLLLMVEEKESENGK